MHLDTKEQGAREKPPQLCTLHPLLDPTLCVSLVLSILTILANNQLSTCVQGVPIFTSFCFGVTLYYVIFLALFSFTPGVDVDIHSEETSNNIIVVVLYIKDTCVHFFLGYHVVSALCYKNCFKSKCDS